MFVVLPPSFLQLVVHCGVSCRATCLTLEKRAVENLERYCSPDVNACKPLDELNNNNSNNSSAESQPHLKYFCTELDVVSGETVSLILFVLKPFPPSVGESGPAGE